MASSMPGPRHSRKDIGGAGPVYRPHAADRLFFVTPRDYGNQYRTAATMPPMGEVRECSLSIAPRCLACIPASVLLRSPGDDQGRDRPLAEGCEGRAPCRGTRARG